MLLEVVSFAGYVGRNLESIGEAHARDLAERGIRLLGSGGVHSGTDTTLLRVLAKRGRLVFGGNVFPAAPDELVDGRHKPLNVAIERNTVKPRQDAQMDE
jgi:hypothetical protein